MFMLADSRLSHDGKVKLGQKQKFTKEKRQN